LCITDGLCAAIEKPISVWTRAESTRKWQGELIRCANPLFGNTCYQAQGVYGRGFLLCYGRDIFKLAKLHPDTQGIEMLTRNCYFLNKTGNTPL
jgi:hypothetical protein